MASFATFHYTVDGTPIPVTTMHHQGMVVTFHNSAKSSNNLIYLGGSTVSTATGVHLDSDQFLQLTLSPEQQVFAVSDPNGLVLEVFEQRM